MKSAAEVANPSAETPQSPDPSSQPLTAAALAAIVPAAGPLTPEPQDRRGTLELLQIVSAAGMLAQFASGIIEAELSRDSFNQDYRLARVFATSGVFKDLKAANEIQSIATAMAKIQLGRGWGLTPADAMEFIYFTNGRPAVMNELIAGKIRDAGYDWDTQWHEESEAPKQGSASSANPSVICVGCTLWLKKFDSESREFKPVLDHGGKEVSVSFTKSDADRAMIWDDGKQIPLSQKWNFKAWPREMYFWRSIARLKRFHVTNVLRGAITIDEAHELPSAGSQETAPPSVSEDLRSRGFRVVDIPASSGKETSTRQTATDDKGGQSSADRSETSAPAESVTVEASRKQTDKPAPETPELTEVQKGVAQYEKSIGKTELIKILGVYGCENIGQVNETNWKAIVSACEEKRKNRRIEFGNKEKP